MLRKSLNLLPPPQKKPLSALKESFLSRFKSLASNKKKLTIKLSLTLSRMVKVVLYF